MGGPESRSGGMVGDYEVRRSWAQILTHEWVNAKRAECGESREGMEVKRTTRGKEGDLGRKLPATQMVHIFRKGSEKSVQKGCGR